MNILGIAILRHIIQVALQLLFGFGLWGTYLFSPWIFWTEGWMCRLHAILLTERIM